MVPRRDSGFGARAGRLQQFVVEFDNDQHSRVERDIDVEFDGGSTAIATIPVQDRSPAGTPGKEPTVTVPSGTRPTQLESADLIVGTGATAEPGDTVTVQYVLATYSADKVIQASWTSQPFTFALGEGQVIKGWDEGVVGMKVGGRRELIIPPSLGYGSSSPGSGIAANDTLVFVVDLLKVG